MRDRVAGLLVVLLAASACGTSVVVDDPVTGVTLATVATTTTFRPDPAAPPQTTTAGPAPTVVEVVEVERFTDLPEAPVGFCADLAAETGLLTVRIEELFADGPGHEARNLHVLLSTSGDLLDWTVRNAPLGMAVDLGILRSVYLDLGAVLDRMDPETVTLDQLRGELFTVMFESPVADGAVLDHSARRLSAFVESSCGPGYPLMDTLSDLFSADDTVLESPRG